MLIKIIATNTHKESVERVLDTDLISLIGEEHQDNVDLYNVDGDLVSSTKPTEKVFFILFKRDANLGTIRVNEDTYNKVLKVLDIKDLTK